MRRKAILLLSALAGCTILGPGSDLHQLHRHRDAWRAQGITNYDFDYLQSCFCPPPRTMRITVRNNLVESATFVDNNQAVVDLSHVPTIDSLFVRMEREMAYEYNHDIKYHATYRFPVEIRGDVPDAIDDEYTITVSNFAQLPVALQLPRLRAP